MNLNIEKAFNEQQNIWEASIQGDLDIFSSSYFRDELLAAWSEQKADMHIDGEKLDYIDSTGLGAMIGLYNKMKENDNEIYVKNLKPNIMKLFVITDLEQVFHIGE